MNLRQALLSWHLPTLVARFWVLGHSVLQSSWGHGAELMPPIVYIWGRLYLVCSPDVFARKRRWVAEKAADMRFECRFLLTSARPLCGGTLVC